MVKRKRAQPALERWLWDTALEELVHPRAGEGAGEHCLLEQKCSTRKAEDQSPIVQRHEVITVDFFQNAGMLEKFVTKYWPILLIYTEAKRSVDGKGNCPVRLGTTDSSPPITFRLNLNSYCGGSP